MDDDCCAAALRVLLARRAAGPQSQQGANERGRYIWCALNYFISGFIWPLTAPGRAELGARRAARHGCAAASRRLTSVAAPNQGAVLVAGKKEAAPATATIAEDATAAEKVVLAASVPNMHKPLPPIV